MPKANNKCSCNPGLMVIAWILISLGIWSVVGGFALQIGSGAPTAMNVNVLWYFLGVLLIWAGKMAKWKSCGACMSHKK